MDVHAKTGVGVGVGGGVIDGCPGGVVGVADGLGVAVGCTGGWVAFLVGIGVAHGALCRTEILECSLLLVAPVSICSKPQSLENIIVPEP